MDPFATLGLPRRYDVDPGELDRRYRELQKALHPDRYTGAGASERRMSLSKAVEVNEAYRVLRDDVKRAEALLALLGPAPGGERETVSSEFLMEAMELREALADAKHARDLSQVQRLAARAEALWAETRRQLAAVFSSLAQSAAPAEVACARALVNQLKYHQRLLDEVSLIREEAEAS